MWFRLVKRYYDLKYYKNDDVKIFVQNDAITSEEYHKITGELYENNVTE